MKLVLDTNVVLDWLVFEDARMSSLQRAWEERRLDLLTHPPALEELRRVLTYPQFKLTASEQSTIMERYESRARIVALPDAVTTQNLGMPAGFPRCKDCDDDHFIALAYHQHADAVVSKDRAVLDLAKRVRKYGVTILSPRQLTAKLGYED